MCTKDIKVATTSTVTLNSNGGNACSPSSKTVVYGGTYGSLCTPTRTNFVFDGWWTLSSGGNRVESTSKVSRPTNHTLYAHWTGNTFSVTYNANGGTGCSGTSTVVGELTVPEFCVPTRSGHIFLGWYDSLTGGNQIVSTITTNTVLYAHWLATNYGEYNDE